MLSEEKDIRKENGYDRPLNFDYPFYKVNTTLYKKAIEDLILTRNIKNYIADEEV